MSPNNEIFYVVVPVKGKRYAELIKDEIDNYLEYERPDWLEQVKLATRRPDPIEIQQKGLW